MHDFNVIDYYLIRMSSKVCFDTVAVLGYCCPKQKCVVLIVFLLVLYVFESLWSSSGIE